MKKPLIILKDPQLLMELWEMGKDSIIRRITLIGNKWNNLLYTMDSFILNLVLSLIVTVTQASFPVP